MLDHQSIGEKLHSIIRQDILSGKYKPGQRLAFDQIAEDNKVSMTPIKEAFLMLEQDNLVEIIPRRGTFVKKYSSKDITEYYQIRLSLEFLAVDLICKNTLDKEYEEKLTQTCKDLKTHYEEKNTQKCIYDDINFHKLLVEASGNSQLYSIIQGLPITNLYSFTNKSEDYMKNSLSYLEEHLTIIDYLKQKQGKKAKEILSEHITMFYENN